jgi:hypothetical protein
MLPPTFTFTVRTPVQLVPLSVAVTVKDVDDVGLAVGFCNEEVKPEGDDHE